MLSEVLAKRLSGRVADPKEHHVERPLRGTDGTHAVVDSTGAGNEDGLARKRKRGINPAYPSRP